MIFVSTCLIMFTLLSLCSTSNFGSYEYQYQLSDYKIGTTYGKHAFLYQSHTDQQNVHNDQQSHNFLIVSSTDISVSQGRVLIYDLETQNIEFDLVGKDTIWDAFAATMYLQDNFLTIGEPYPTSFGSVYQYDMNTLTSMANLANSSFESLKYISSYTPYADFGRYFTTNTRYLAVKERNQIHIFNYGAINNTTNNGYNVSYVYSISKPLFNGTILPWLISNDEFFVAVECFFNEEFGFSMTTVHVYNYSGHTESTDNSTNGSFVDPEYFSVTELYDTATTYLYNNHLFIAYTGYREPNSTLYVMYDLSNRELLFGMDCTTQLVFLDEKLYLCENDTCLVYNIDSGDLEKELIFSDTVMKISFPNHNYQNLNYLNRLFVDIENFGLVISDKNAHVQSVFYNEFFKFVSKDYLITYSESDYHYLHVYKLAQHASSSSSLDSFF